MLENAYGVVHNQSGGGALTLNVHGVRVLGNNEIVLNTQTGY